MPRTDSLPQLTPAELDVMKVLWAVGRQSAREVHESLAERQGRDIPPDPPRGGRAYSTTRTTMERLVKKGVLGKKAFHGLHLYEPKISRAAGLARLVRDFARQVLETSPVPVVSLFAESGTLTAEEIAELESLLATEEAS